MTKSSSSSSSSSSSCFFTVCILHSFLALTSGSLIMFYLHEISVLSHGIDTARSLLTGSTPQDQILIHISDSFVGLLLFVIGFLLFMVSFVRDGEFQSFFAKGCVMLHLAVGVWRVCCERRVEELAKAWPRQLVGDLVLALSWVLFLVYSWVEKYD